MIIKTHFGEHLMANQLLGQPHQCITKDRTAVYSCLYIVGLAIKGVVQRRLEVFASVKENSMKPMKQKYYT